MKFCKNCGKELNDDAVFCTGCGANVGGPAQSGSTAPSDGGIPPASGGTTPVGPVGGTFTAEPPAAGGGFYQGSTPPGQSGAYVGATTSSQSSAYQGGAQPGQSGPYYQGNQYAQQPPANQGQSYQSGPAGQGQGYYQGGAPNAPQGPYYQGSPYGGNQPGGGPNYPKSGGNKPLIIVIIAIIAVIVIGGGIFAILQLTKKGDDVKPSPSVSASASPSVKPSPSPSPSIKPSPSEEPSPSGTPTSGEDALAVFDPDMQDSILTAFDDVGLDSSLIEDFEEYSTWFQGTVYSFTYDGSVVDMFLRDEEGTVFTIETGGVQVYLDGYEPYSLGDYLGSESHYDELQPGSGYMFYVNGSDVDSTIHFSVADNFNYVVELLDPSDNSLISAFFVSKDQPIAMSVPTGKFVIQFCAGDEWLGVEDLFGDETYYFRADKNVTTDPANDSYFTLDITNGSGTAATQIDPGEF